MSLKHVLLQGREKIPGKDNEAMKGLKLEKYESLFPRVYRTKGVVHMDILENLAAHSVLTGCAIIFEMTVSPSLFIKSSIYACRADMYQMINHLHQKKLGLIDPLRSNMKRIFELLKS